eukprot:2477814-Rhodomonas_salina.5
MQTALDQYQTPQHMKDIGQEGCLYLLSGRLPAVCLPSPGRPPSRRCALPLALPSRAVPPPALPSAPRPPAPAASAAALRASPALALHRPLSWHTHSLYQNPSSQELHMPKQASTRHYLLISPTKSVTFRAHGFCP